MAYVNIVTALAVLQLIAFGFLVGSARVRYNIKAPASSGDPVFERYFRVQMNTLEQVVALVPGLYLFSHYFNPLVAAGLGVLYLVGRVLYATSYIADPKKRGPGFLLSFAPVVFLLVGGIVGAVRELL